MRLSGVLPSFLKRNEGRTSLKKWDLNLIEKWSSFLKRNEDQNRAKLSMEISNWIPHSSGAGLPGYVFNCYILLSFLRKCASQLGLVWDTCHNIKLEIQTSILQEGILRTTSVIKKIFGVFCCKNHLCFWELPSFLVQICIFITYGGNVYYSAP